VKILKCGGVIVYPTETAYGLGADFLNPKAVKKVYQIKGRNYKKPLSVIVSSLKMAKQYVKFNRLSLKLAKKYWPGPLTLVLKSQKLKVKSQNYNSKIKTLGLRISSNKLATAIVKKLGRPLTATSANVSGKGECFSVKDIIRQFQHQKYQPDLVIDAGRLPKKRMSTIVQVIDNQVKVLRRGAVKL
jgi:L-threonylcarbamoyladenylate synthase